MSGHEAGEVYVGLMSGTSFDGVDAALVDCAAASPRVLAHVHDEYPASLREAALAIQQVPGTSLNAALVLHQQLADWYADAVIALLANANFAADDVRAVGCHGQTVAHSPGGDYGYTLQLGSGARIAARTGITTVTDFRSADIASGGQGAPLAPLFHALAFGRPGEARAVLNLGGIANLTLLGVHGGLLGGFDTGPANVLMDGWMQSRAAASHDRDGSCARAGTVLPHLLAALLQHPFLELNPPKSTGREDFNLGWLETVLARTDHTSARVSDVQATLAQFTAQTITDAITKHALDTGTLIVCGGGAYNVDLMDRLQRCLPGLAVTRSDAYGLAPEWIEAVAFAWLAAQCIKGIAHDLGCVTGAGKPAVLGCIYPA